jgi:hypothetical protein
MFTETQDNQFWNYENQRRSCGFAAGKHFLNPAIVPAAQKLAFAFQKPASTV